MSLKRTIKYYKKSEENYLYLFHDESLTRLIRIQLSFQKLSSENSHSMQIVEIEFESEKYAIN